MKLQRSFVIVLAVILTSIVGTRLLLAQYPVFWGDMHGHTAH